jgi:hypothetical protein
MDLSNMLSIELNFCWEPQGVFPSCETCLYQCLLPKWTDTYILVCSAYKKDIALNHQSFTAPITTIIQTKRATLPFNRTKKQL